METDSLTTTRALSSPVAVDDVLEYFDEIAYIKVRKNLVCFYSWESNRHIYSVRVLLFDYYAY